MAEVTIRFIGRSMLPTLKAGDILGMALFTQREIQVGDIIAFNGPNGGALTVHRAVSVDLNGVRTRGDNNFIIDNWVLSPDDIIGRIVSVYRQRKKVIILNGFLGRTYAFFLGNLRNIYSTLLFVILSRLYHWIAEAGMLRKLFLRQSKIRLYCFKRNNDLELQLLWGRRIIGRLSPGQKQWYIKCPFKLIIDEESLPNNIVDHVSLQISFT